MTRKIICRCGMRFWIEDSHRLPVYCPSCCARIYDAGGLKVMKDARVLWE